MTAIAHPRRVVDQVAVTLDLDPWWSLRGAASYTGLSVRTLRGWLSHSDRPLPCYRVGGKILLRRSELDGWLAGFRHVGPQELDRTVEEILRAIRAEPNQELGGQITKVSEKKRTGAKADERVAAGSQNGAE